MVPGEPVAHATACAALRHKRCRSSRTSRRELFVQPKRKADHHGSAFAIGRGSLAVYDMAARTRSGVNGTRRMRTPVASKIALAIAAATGLIDGSPAPDGAISGWSISTVSMLDGVSVMSRIG